MAAINFSFSMIAGDTEKIVATVTDENNDALPVSSATIKYVVRDSVGGTQRISKTTTSGIVINSNVFTISLDPADTVDLAANVYYHESEITFGGDVYTAFYGNIEIGATGV